MSDRFEVHAVCDQVAHRAEQVAAEFNADTVDGYRTLAMREDIDAVLLLSPQWYGALPILAACESGKAVYCAAGLDLEFEEVQLVKTRVVESGIAFMAEFPRRHSPATIRLKGIDCHPLGQAAFGVLSSTFGRPTSEHCLPVRPPEHFSAQHLVELVDWCCYVIDRQPSLVTGLMHRTGCNAADDDYQMMSLDFSESAHPGSGPVAQDQLRALHSRRLARGHHLSPAGVHAGFVPNGIAFVDLPATLVWFDEAGRHVESLDSERPIGEQMLTQFYRAVTSLVRLTSDLEDAYRALYIVREARRSHQEGRRIALEI